MKIDVVIDNVAHELDVAEHWDMLDGDQWRGALLLLSKSWAKGVMGKYRAALALLCADRKTARVLLDKMPDDLVLGLMEAIEWLNTPPIQFKSKMRWYGIWKGPQDDLQNLTMEQLGFVQQYVAAVKGAEDERVLRGHLRMLMACVFTLFGLRFRAKWVPLYSWLLRLVPMNTLLLNMTNVHAMLMGLRERYEWVYDEDAETDDGMPQHGFRSLLNALAGNKFGDYYEVKRARLHDVMVHMDVNAYEVHKMKQNAKKES